MKMEATGDRHADQNKPHLITCIFLSYAESILHVYLRVYI